MINVSMTSHSMISRYRILMISVLLMTVSITLMSCSRTANPDISRGSSYLFIDGYPEIRATALGYLDENDEGEIRITADVVEGSLIYRNLEGVNRANIAIEINVRGTDEGSTFTNSYRRNLIVENTQPTFVTTQDAFKFERLIDVPPGNYEIVISVLDQASGKESSRSVETFIPDPGNDIVNLTTVQLHAKDNDRNTEEFFPVTTYDVTADKDSIRFLVQVTNNRSEDPLTINSRLIRFRADTTAARPMSFTNYNPASIPYKGIDYSDFEIRESSRRVLEQPGSVMIQYNFPLPQRGNYRFEVYANRDGEEELFKARDFSVKSENYPTLKTPKELAEPLVYLMSDGDYEDLLSIQNPDSLKEAIDRFWLSNIRSTSRARNVISLYYERVEEANKQFSNFKEGWKTDSGMIYILFGPPWYVDTSLNTMQWSYSYDRYDSNYNFVFQRPKMRNEFYPFNNYLLNRHRSYFNLQYQQVELWLSGMILTRDM